MFECVEASSSFNFFRNFMSQSKINEFMVAVSYDKPESDAFIET